MISPATLQDAPTLAQIAAGNPCSAHWSSTDFEKEITNPAALVLKAQTDGGITGFICCRYTPPDAELTNFAISNNFLRKGLGAALLKQSFQNLKQKGVNSITLEVNEHNIAAINLYFKFGFKQVSRRKKFYNGKDDALLLKGLI